MKIHESAEDYLERILVLKNQNGKVISIDIANSMNYSKPSISRAMKNLKEAGYIVINSKGEIELTENGSKIANRIYERHILLTIASRPSSLVITQLRNSSVASIFF